ncbi:hypothetical protein P1S61_39480 [Streptomyces sp. ME08-AFT2]|uniref:DUF3800 domain-containing protein n=1 Tax=Streptomyces sp. ME08-AFT2 TaxID=3028683 RepID=UPI0029A75E48|nr:DUF3800 domain-containing protein [Streptomyces sp. ME08-AFT2]MDX3315037.1 hypothetical protein [Streptomyces sp. ME08-AFT2]
MRLIFIDDSRQRNCPRKGLGDLVALGAVSVPEKAISPFAESLQEIRNDLGIPDDEELKWKPAKGSFLATAGGELVTQLRQRMLQAAIDHEIRSMVVIIDHSAAYTGRTLVQVGQEILKWLYERITMHLGDHGELGVVIADKPGGGPAQEGKWLAETLKLTNGGTEYVKPDKVVLPIVTAPSHHIPHLQLADLVVAASTAAVAGIPAGLALKDLLYPLAHQHGLGAINGAGVVIFPDHPNLYFWAFGETLYARPAYMSGYDLPSPFGSYSNDDGLQAETSDSSSE